MRRYSSRVILAAGLLVLLGLGLFVAGILTGATAFYWACVAACAVAAVLLIASRRQLRAAPAEPARDEPAAEAAARTAEQPAVDAGGPTADDAAPGTGDAVPAGVHATAHRTPSATAAGSAGATSTGSHAAPEHPVSDDAHEPPVEEVEVTDLLLVVDLTDEVLVVDEHPRYHLEGCRFLSPRETIPLPLDEARTDGFTPCGWCTPDRHLADRERARKRG